MARKSDALSSLINSRYFHWIREAILQHENVNIQALSEKFRILAGNTYFRNFIKDKNQDYLGVSGLTNILEECGYKLMLVPIREDDITTEAKLGAITRESFSDIRDKVSDFAAAVKRPPKKVKAGPKKVKNNSVINNGIMGLIDNNNFDIDDLNDIDDMFDDDELEIGVGSFDPKKVAAKKLRDAEKAAQALTDS